jgi:hypothetical protein
MTTVFKKEKQIVLRDVFVSCTCDWCKKDLPYDYGNESYSTYDVEIEVSSGESYPDGGSKEGWRVNDLCKECAAKLRTTLEDLGITVEPFETDW